MRSWTAGGSMPTPLSDVEAEALGRRWIAAGGGWREGMLSLDGWRVLAAGAICVCATDGGGDGADAVERRECSAALLGAPDLRDAATRGAALEVVRDRWESPTAYVRQSGRVCRQGTKIEDHDLTAAWEVCDLHISSTLAATLGVPGGSVGCSLHLSEPHALVFALEARHAL